MAVGAQSPPTSPMPSARPQAFLPHVPSPWATHLPWQTLSPTAPLSWKPASQLHCRVLSTCAQRGARLKAGSPAVRSGAAAGTKPVRAAPASRTSGGALRTHSAGGEGGTVTEQNLVEGVGTRGTEHSARHMLQPGPHGQR